MVNEVIRLKNLSLPYFLILHRKQKLSYMHEDQVGEIFDYGTIMFHDSDGTWKN